MLLVVFGHSLLMMRVHFNQTVAICFCQTLELPLFFMISGFFAYINPSKLSSLNFGVLLKRKAQALLISTFVFYYLYQLCFGQTLTGWMERGFGWFWFCIALFQMFMIYFCAAITDKYFRTGKCLTILLPSIALIFIMLELKFPYFACSHRIGRILEWNGVTGYFQYFVGGLLLKRYFNVLERWFKSNWLVTISLIGFVLLFYIAYVAGEQFVGDIDARVIGLVRVYGVRWAGVVSVTLFFYSKAEWFSSAGRVSGWLQLVGRRTLDIYMLHVFFLPTLPRMVEFITSGRNMLLIQLVAGGSIAILVSCVALLTGEIIRTSPFLSQWLFGTKKPAIQHKEYA